MSENQSNEIITIDEYNINYTNNLNTYTPNIYFKSISGEKIYEYAIMNNLTFYTFIDKIYNRISKDFGLNYDFEIIPLSHDIEYGLEIKDYLLYNDFDINQIESRDILNNNNSYYVRTNAEKQHLYMNIDHNNECPVCYEKNILYKFYVCYHKLCKKCYLNWKCRLGTTCPICRSC
jgi:hypothetical protein